MRARTGVRARKRRVRARAKRRVRARAEAGVRACVWPCPPERKEGCVPARAFGRLACRWRRRRPRRPRLRAAPPASPPRSRAAASAQ
eukprot:1682151-Pleurochrysis_carterae.AAC.1